MLRWFECKSLKSSLTPLVGELNHLLCRYHLWVVYNLAPRPLLHQEPITHTVAEAE